MFILLGESFTFVTITPRLGKGERRPDHTHLVTDGRGESWNPCTRIDKRRAPLPFLSRARAAREEVHDHRNDGEKQQDVN
jgi:hypothetical protein